MRTGRITATVEGAGECGSQAGPNWGYFGINGQGDTCTSGSCVASYDHYSLYFEQNTSNYSYARNLSQLSLGSKGWIDWTSNIPRFVTESRPTYYRSPSQPDYYFTTHGAVT